MKKIVQIAFAPSGDADYISSTAYALLDDGTVYLRSDNGWLKSVEFENLINEINEEEEK